MVITVDVGDFPRIQPPWGPGPDGPGPVSHFGSGWKIPSHRPVDPDEAWATVYPELM